MYFNVQLLNEDAQIPKRGSKDAAGYDIFASEEVQIPPHSRSLVSTGISCEIPPNYYIRVASRSGLAVKNGIDVGAGVVDSDYRGEVKVLLFNHDDKVFQVRKGDRIAQLIIEHISTPDITLVGYLGSSERGIGGFGSTDKVIPSEK